MSGVALLCAAALGGLGLVVVVLTPARQVTSAEINTTMSVSVPAGDRGLYTTLSSWRAASCSLVAADGTALVLRSDMTQQDLLGAPTWYAQGSFHLDRPQRITVTCTGPAGRFGVGPLVALGGVLTRVLVGLLTALLLAAGLLVVIVGRVRSRRS
ncbi:MAG TPA: hypothetical protein VFU98_09885 [Microlunatus sp.]|nr:hypothetical protein [Microlunatus sp.]